MAPTFINVVRSGIAELAALDPSRTLFGAGSHDYRFAPVIDEATLASFEEKASVRLTDDYRDFITQIGNGGAGPSYGVMGFRAKDPEDYTAYERLGTPWAYTEAYNPVEILDGDGDESEYGQEAYWKAFNSDGALYLCHHGCASRSLLVVSGPCRGEVWSDEVANDAGYAPESNLAGARATFRTWYVEWLEKAIAQMKAKATLEPAPKDR